MSKKFALAFALAALTAATSATAAEKVPSAGVLKQVHAQQAATRAHVAELIKTSREKGVSLRMAANLERIHALQAANRAKIAEQLANRPHVPAAADHEG